MKAINELLELNLGIANDFVEDSSIYEKYIGSSCW